MPSRLGRYVVRRRIGSGGFATVWLAYDEQLDAPVAVKVLADNWTEDHQVRTRFVEEGRYLRRVESPHVVSVYDAGELDDGRPYLVMSYADQGTLADRLEVAGTSVAQGLEVVRQVAAGLQALHDRGIIHRDVKPANVLFRTVDPGSGTTELRAMLGDLGLGKALDSSSRLTMIAGTPSFVAPEQAQGESPDARADQYSLGVLTFLLLSGRTPWAHASLGAAADPPPPPRLSTDERSFPAAVEDVVRRALARERDERWPSVVAYVDALTSAIADSTTIEDPLAPATGWLAADPELTQPGARPTLPPVSAPLPDPDLPAPRPRRRRRVALAAAGVAVAALAGAGGYGAAVALQAEPSTSPITVEDETGTLEVTVPRAWTAQARTQWRPPNATDQDFAALSVGTSPTWVDGSGAEGVFVGVLPGSELPGTLPQHPDCAQVGSRMQSEVAGDEAATQVFSACDGADVVVERVVQISTGQLLWVQIRAVDQPAAVEVLESVRVYGV
jgi:hypothetical protein